MKKGLPKKYAKMGFKKGWIAYKKAKNKTSSLPKKRKAIKQTYKRTMAKRKKAVKKRSSSRVLGFNIGKIAAPMIYGAVREKASNLLMPYTSRIPLGSISDEVGMYAALWAAKKYVFKQKGVLRDALSVGQNIELARIGETAINGQLGLGSLFNGGQTQTSGYVFN